MPTRNRIAVAIAVLAMSAAAGSAYAQQSYLGQMTIMGSWGSITMYDRPTSHYTVPVRLCGRNFFVTSTRNDAHWVRNTKYYKVTTIEHGVVKVICSHTM